jgi:hypothetical protein
MPATLIRLKRELTRISTVTDSPGPSKSLGG